MHWLYIQQAEVPILYPRYGCFVSIKIYNS